MYQSKKRSSIVFIYILLLSIAFIPRYGNTLATNTLKYIATLIIIILATMKFLISHKKQNDLLKDSLNFTFFYYFVPVFLIHLYSLIMSLFGVFNKIYLSTNISAYFPVILAIASIYLFEEKAFKYSFISIIITWFTTVLVSLLLNGFGIFPFAIMQAYFDKYEPILGVTINYFEMHDIILTLGLVLLYYIYFNKEKTKQNVLKILIIIIIMIMGIKRITILGLFISSIFVFFIKWFKDNKKIKICFYAGIIMILLCYGYIFIIKSNIFTNIFTNSKINLMGRNYYFVAFDKYYDFSPKYLGMGRNSISYVLTNYLNYYKVAGIHNDILKMYIENGFIVFGLWTIHYLITITKKYYKKVDINVAILYFTLTIYTFVLYTTDNVENYFLYQFIYIIIPITYSMKIKKEELTNSKRLKGETNDKKNS